MAVASRRSATVTSGLSRPTTAKRAGSRTVASKPGSSDRSALTCALRVRCTALSGADARGRRGSKAHGVRCQCVCKQQHLVEQPLVAEGEILTWAAAQTKKTIGERRLAGDD